MKNFIFFLVLLLVAFLSIATMAQTNFWQKINNPYGDTVRALSINSIGTIFIGTNNGVSRSTDNGVNWIEGDIGLYFIPRDFAFNSSGTIFCIGGSIEWVGVLRSTDDGANWTKVYDQEPIKTIAINDSGYIFIGWGHEMGGGVERSVDNGASWINTGLEANSYALAINANGTIFSGGWYSNGGCIFRSTDNGASWINTLALSYYNIVNKLEISPTGHIFAVTSYNIVYRSTDNGEQWTQMGGLPTSWITTLAINTSGYIFAGTYGEGVFRSTDDGVNWTAVNTGLTSDSVASIAINPNGIIFAITTDGLFRSVQSTTSVRELSADTPISFSLNQNYPNPFNPTTTIQFHISKSSFVNLKVYDFLGNEVVTLVNEEKSIGSYEVEYDATGLSSGIYFYKLQAGSFVETKKMILLK